jgi:hypothetical protein
MTHGDGRGRGRESGRRRAVMLATVAVGVALLAAACGGSSSSPPSGGVTNQQTAVAYAQCVRAHGVPNFPDPNSQGEIIISGQNINQSQLQTAKADCKKLLPAGGSGQVPESQEHAAMSQLLKYSSCMRAHGITNFPDPVSNGHGVSFPGTTGLDPHSQQFQSAQQACRSLLPTGTPS